MSSSQVEEGSRAGGGCLLGNWVEERATTSLDNTGPTSDIHKNGHRGILTVDLSSKLHGVSTLKSAFTSPKGTRVRQKGLRSELLEKHLIKSISEQVHAELTPKPSAPELNSVTRTDYTVEGFQCVRPTPSTDRDYRTDEAITFWRENFDKIQVHAELTPKPSAPELNSVTRTDYTVEGFQCVRPTPSTDRDYRTDEAITFWRENFDKIQGVTAVRNRDAPFKKNASFTAPINECLDPNPENYIDIEEV
ncbi:hypothetical protein PGIGA_G00166980 [Pangasianodon gigas]|uniref:Uncharacterized protein n=1 Tax=Pangasianodon gigas TaxID=30993 RepID=A0ACC5XT83_PANGG|nr:hypothetical protein [Pangasianodon gigas]